MKIQLTAIPRPDYYAESKKRWRENNPERYREVSALSRNQARNNARLIRGFVGVDGEGMRTRCETSGCDCTRYVHPDNDRSACPSCHHAEDSHYHAYVLFGVGDQYIDTEMLGIDEIGWEEALEFLYREFLKPANRYKVFCGFSLGYDFTHIFKSIPRDKAWKLYNARGNLHSESNRNGDTDRRPVSDRKPLITSRERARGKPWPVRISGKRGSWEFDTLDERQLRLRPFDCGCADPEYHAEHCKLRGCSYDHHLTGQFCHWRDETVKQPEWMYVNDVFSFFQKSFLKVIDPIDWFAKFCDKCQRQPCLTHDTVSCSECKPPACSDHGIVTRDEYLAIKEGKERRETAVLDEEMREYNKRENLILSRVMEKYREGLNHYRIFLDIDEWYGPGQAAGKWIEKQGQHAACAQHTGKSGGVTRNENPLHRKEAVSRSEKVVERAARASYIAGWFEIFAHGHIPGITYEYDINSAYPAVIKDLPCMAHGRWEVGYSGGRKLRALPKGAAFRLVHATVTGNDPHIGAMLHRDADNNICRPHVTHSWYWQDELKAAQDAGLIDTIEIGCDQEACRDEYRYDGALTLTYYPHPVCERLCASMADMYQERLRVGKSTPMGKAAKLVYNSVYGKFAQLVGTPPWASNIYASRITSGCRKKILEAIATHPEGSRAVVMIATDGIYFTSKHPALEVSKDKLGMWTEETHENLTLFKPGVYWDDATREQIRKGEAPQFKSRGVSARKFARQISKVDAMFSAWNGAFPDDEGAWPTVTFKAGFAMTSCKQALIRGKWETAGKVSTSGTLTQNSFPDSKRAYTTVVSDSGDIANTALRITGKYVPEYRIYRSEPIRVGYVVSEPRNEYQTSQHMKNEGENLEALTPDGTLSDLLAGVLGIRE